MNAKTLKYKLGDIVFLKNDPRRKNPLVISKVDSDNSETWDYEIKWFNSQRKLESAQIREELLVFPE